MIDELALLSLLSDGEKTAFVRYLEDRNKRNDAKNIQLFYALQSRQVDEFRSKMTDNAYHVLKNRLHDRLVDFVSTQIIQKEQSVPVEIMKRLILSRKLLKLRYFKTAFKQLKKAEVKAIEISDYHLLNEIYQTLIQYSYHDDAPDQELLFESFDKNNAKYSNQVHLNMVYAIVRKAFKEYGQKEESLDLEDLIAKSFKKYNISDDFGYTFQTLCQIAELTDISGAHQRNYFNADLFFEKYYPKIQGSSLDTEKDLAFHIKFLYLMAHVYFRKKQFQKSMEYLRQMNTQMLRYEKKYYSIYELRYISLLALNYNFSGSPEDAGNLFDEVLKETYILNNPKADVLQAYLARIMIHFQQEELTEAKEKLAELNQQDNGYLKTVGLEWLLNKKFMEILLQIEVGNVDYAESLIKSLLRKRKSYFTGANSLAYPFLKLIDYYHKYPEEVRSVEFNQKVENTFDWKPAEEEDIFFISFYAWLKSKMLQNPLYSQTISLIQSSNENIA